jgi:tetratricopeptide (TPR) repeat protein
VPEELVEFGRTGEALEILAKAAASAPTESEDFACLGWAYFVCGEYPKSIEWTRQAVDNDPDSIAAQCNLALATLDSDNQEQAQQEYQEAIETVRRLKLPEGLKDNAILDLEKALTKNPGRTGGMEMLAIARHSRALRLRERE